MLLLAVNVIDGDGSWSDMGLDPLPSFKLSIICLDKSHGFVAQNDDHEDKLFYSTKLNLYVVLLQTFGYHLSRIISPCRFLDNLTTKLLEELIVHLGWRHVCRTCLNSYIMIVIREQHWNTKKVIQYLIMRIHLTFYLASAVLPTNRCFLSALKLWFP